jgi:predicted molibdopterin-dependent oxidoreductase YjgC
MLDAAASGQLKALWAIGYDVLLTNPNARQTARAFERLELVIIQDMFMTETARESGSVFLPACSSFEAGLADHLQPRACDGPSTGIRLRDAEGELFATFHTAKTFLNTVTGPHVDRATGTPEYKSPP